MLADFPKFDRNTNRGGAPGPPLRAEQTIHHDADHPSHLVLSVLGRVCEQYATEPAGSPATSSSRSRAGRSRRTVSCGRDPRPHRGEEGHPDHPSRNGAPSAMSRWSSRARATRSTRPRADTTGRRRWRRCSACGNGWEIGAPRAHRPTLRAGPRPSGRPRSTRCTSSSSASR